ncbi:hypothetical protein Tco_1449538 [Tanacetum coccineum]
MSQNLKLHHLPLKHLQLQHPKLKHTKLQYLKLFFMKLTLSKFSHLQLLIKEKERLKNVGEPKRTLSYLRLPLDHGADEAVHTEGVVVWKGLSLLWQSQVPRYHGGTPAQTKMEHTFELMDNVPSTPHDSPLPGGYTPGSDEGRMKLDELITLCTKLSKQVIDLEKKKDAQAVEILNLKRKTRNWKEIRNQVNLHPRRRKYRQVETSSDDGLDEKDASKQGRISDKLKPMFNDKDFEELDDYMENVEEETVDVVATRVSTVNAPVSTAGVTILIG